jgi:hypothetical protein
MKLRIKSNSIRYRLTKSDVKNLTENGCLEDGVNFGPLPLKYAIEIRNNGNLSAGFLNSTITLFMPLYMLDALADTDQVGFENEDNGLQLLVEKDFTCLDNIIEDQSDNYPNPLLERDLEEEG